MAVPAWFVVLMGIGTVFVGLICIVLICSLFGLVLSRKKAPETPSAQPEISAEKKEELLAVIAASIAAYSKTDPACIRVLSVKKSH